MSMELLRAPATSPRCSTARTTPTARTASSWRGSSPSSRWIRSPRSTPFQHWVYAHPGHTPVDRRAAWIGLLDRFGGIVDWSGFEEARANGWHRQLHIFLYPFYYIEYGIAQLGALQIWRRSLVDRPGAVADYRRALAIGGARPLPELFEAAGAKFEFTEASLGPLMDAIGKELDQLAP